MGLNETGRMQLSTYIPKKTKKYIDISLEQKLLYFIVIFEKTCYNLSKDIL
jgi:hypothetical protein